VSESNGNGVRRGVRFDPTINLGHLLTAAAFLTSTIVAWVNLDARVAQNARDLLRVEGQANKETVRVETVLMDRINTVQGQMNQTQVRTADDVREIKTIIRDGFRDLDTKIDRKVDKPGR
jgi:hypothetical protein